MDKIIKKYQYLANKVDPTIRCHRSALDWYSIPLSKEVYIPRFSLDRLGTENFRLSVLGQLPRYYKGLVNTLPPELWSFYHELGHIKLQHTSDNDILLRGFANFLGKRGFSKLSNKIYFKLKQEKQATKWAIDYITSHLEEVKADWKKLETATFQTYSKRYKKLIDKLS